MNQSQNIYLGISSFAYKWSFGIPGYPQAAKPLDEEGLIQRAADLGVDLVQLGDNCQLHTKTEKQLSRLKALADEKNLRLEIGTTGTDPKGLKRHLEIARILGAGLVRSMVGSRTKTESLETAESNLKAVCGDFEKEGILLALENYELYSVADLAALIDRVSSPALGACLDTTNSIGALEIPDVVVKALAPYAFCLHIKDIRFKRVDYGLGFNVQGCPVGEGVLEIEKIFKTVFSYDRLVSVVLEQWTPYQGDVEQTIALQDRWAVMSIEYLKRHLNSLTAWRG